MGYKLTAGYTDKLLHVLLVRTWSILLRKYRAISNKFYQAIKEGQNYKVEIGIELCLCR